jgi:hypothetical protein
MALPETIASPEQAGEILDQVVAALRKLAVFWLQHDERSTLGYHLAHAASFVGVAPDGQRAPTALSPQTLSTLQDWSAAAQHTQVVSGAHILMEKYGTLSLDFEFLLAQALEAEGYEEAQRTVTAQAVELRTRLGSATGASADTLAWLDGAAPPAPATPRPAAARPAAAQPSAETQPDNVDQITDEAAKLAKNKGLEAGCGLLHAELDRSGTKPTRFRLRLALASLCVEHGAADLARPLLQDLYTELQEPIAEWERDLLVKVATATLACDRQLARMSREPIPELEEEAIKMMTLLARVDPQAAYRERKKG